MMAGTEKDESMYGEDPYGAGKLSFLALAEDWLTAQDALSTFADDAREAMIEDLRRQWDHGTLVVDPEAVVDRLYERSARTPQQNRLTGSEDPGETS